jgi:cytidyltransferase-like protein
MTIVLVTGGFDPLHSGHIDYFDDAKKLGDKLVVGLNSDDWLTRKKGRPFMPFEERYSVLSSLKMVDEVISFDDSNDSATDAINKTLSMYPSSESIVFANGGDRVQGNIPELEHFTNNLRVMFAFGVGGDNKKNSSSWILEEWKAPKTIREWGWYRVLEEQKGYKIKELVIEPNKELSMQKHKYRNEHWYVLKGSCIIDRRSGVVENLSLFGTTTIFSGQWHKAINVKNERCHVLEVQTGSICEEWDIERDNSYDNSPDLPNFYSQKFTKEES